MNNLKKVIIIISIIIVVFIGIIIIILKSNDNENANPYGNQTEIYREALNSMENYRIW